MVRLKQVLMLSIGCSHSFLPRFVPKPKPEVFRVTKTNHNILQGVSKPEERLSKDQQQLLADWVESNAKSFWLSEGGSLRAASAGGADVIIVDDPQMPDLVRLAK